MDRAVAPDAPVAVVGTGLIGQSWAVAFARAGHPVRLHDADAHAAVAAEDTVAELLDALDAVGLLGGQMPGEVATRIARARDLGAALDGVAHVQENTPETLELKRAVFAELDRAAPADAILASSSSALMPSAFAGGLDGAARCLVVHPLNPPHLIPAVEIVPGPDTAADVVEAAASLMAAIGQRPIRARREVEGFIMNRLQGALLDEAFALVAGGVAGVEDVDAAIRDGLARRWSFMGPFETIDLNAPDGVADFIDRYGPAYAEIGRDRGGRPDWAGPLRDAVVEARRAALPQDGIAARQRWRDRELAALAAFRAEREAKHGDA